MNMKKTICLILALLMLVSLIPLAASAGGADLGMASLNGAAYEPMTTSQKMVDILKDFEGFSAEPYWDVNQWSVGYGSACGTDPNNKPPIRVTETEAEQMLNDLLENNYAKTVNDYCKRIGKQPSQNQFDALVDFTYNLGSSWTSGCRLSSWLQNPTTEIDLVDAMGVWCRVSGSISYNHVMRRIREAVIFLHGEYSLPYGTCSSSLSVVSDRSLPYYKAVIFSANGGSYGSRGDTVRFYEKGSSYDLFPTPELSEHTLSGYQVVAVNNRKVAEPYTITADAVVEDNLKLEAVWDEIAPETTEPETTEPETTETEATEPETTEPETTAPAPTETEATEPETTEPETTAPAPAETEATEPETTVPETTAPAPTETEATEPETTAPETTAPAPTETEATEPETTVPETTAPAPTETEATEPETTVPETTAPTPTETEATEPETTVPETTAPAPAKPEATEPEVTEAVPSEPEAMEPETTEPEVTEQEASTDLPFRDVRQNDWFYEPVAFVQANGYMAGTSTTTFSPQMAMSRAMLVQVLYRIAGSPAVTDAQRSSFIDCQNAYYTDAVAWAKANGIVCGVSEDRFAPDQMVTRQDAVLIFYQYFNYLGLDGSANADLSRFIDTDRVSGYARTAMEWAVSRNLISGAATNSGLALNPRGNLTRAESATILKAFVTGILN